MGNLFDLKGMKFGRLMVIERDNSKNGDKVFWKCICDCGVEKSVASANLRSGHTTSCGCKRAETEAKHFSDPTPLKKENQRLYSIWKSMRARCGSEKHKEYHNYGGRGIRICDAWLGRAGFANFVCWSLENGYREDLTIDRIDFNGNYCPENCRWVPHKVNQNNKRDNRYIEINGEIMTLSQWADAYGLTQCELKRRIDYLGLPVEIAISYSGLPKTTYNGKILSIRRLAQMKYLDYKTLLHLILVDNMNADDAIEQMENK